ncbi:acetyltransferase [Microbacterium mangrovi]|uniref:Acetyltransferase n=1 Tax=Microbacterium mangrovi TaxID=1348253 RepID=A0A0B1ZWN3_9MICO|nr:GNAT family N-acetyltransferase [Microbacterium mangrovi]KHK95154.1 acetyltransferase [Microbacterium mangrovi]
MPLPADYRLVTVPETRQRDVLTLDVWAFPTEHTVDKLMTTPPGLPWGERTFAVERDGIPGYTGFHATYALQAYPVPGAEVSCGWLTWVGVHPGHRRRGILRAMIEHHFADCLAHGEAFSALTASEPSIYGRFGYGLAANVLSLNIPRGAALRSVAGSDALSVELAEWDAAAHSDLVADIHREYGRLPAGLGRPGWATRETADMRTYWDADPEHLRGGRESRRLVVVRDAGGRPTAFAAFRRTLKWEGMGSDGTVHVREAVALDAASAHRLWTVLLDLDLMNRVEVDNVATDDAIMRLLVDPRAVEPKYADHTWVRLLDVPRALAERRYAGDIDVVLEVTDAMVPANAGRWRVVASAFGHAEVTPTDAEPQLVLDVRELGSVHLGSVTWTSLAQAGLIEVRDPAALAPAAVAWSWPVAAAANWVF